MVVKMRQKLSVYTNARYRRPPRYDLERMKKPHVIAAYAQNLKAVLLDEDELEVASPEDC